MVNLTYPVERYLGLFPEDRAKELAEASSHWVNPKLENGNELKQLWLNPESGYAFFLGSESKEHIKNSQKSYQIRAFEKLLTPEELELCNSEASRVFEEDRERRFIEKAEKVNREDWDGPVFDDDRYYSSLDDLLEYISEEGDLDLPKYVNVAEEKKTLYYHDLDLMLNYIENKLYDVIGDNDFLDDINSDQELENAWKNFVDKYTHTFWVPSKNKIILLE